MEQKKEQKWWLIALIYAITLLTIGYSAYTNNLPTYLGRIPHYDFWGHIILYALATYLGHRVFYTRKVKIFSYRVSLFPLLFGIATVVDECLQTLSPYRNFSIFDLIGSFLGIFIGYWLVEKHFQQIRAATEDVTKC